MSKKIVHVITAGDTEIMGELISEDQHYYVLTNPLVVEVNGYTENGAIYTYTKYIHSHFLEKGQQNKIFLNKYNIFASVYPEPIVVKSYMSTVKYYHQLSEQDSDNSIPEGYQLN